ncbi:MAG: signal recognition particle-docking protein FtsY, partial [Sulfolobales archaeon]
MVCFDRLKKAFTGFLNKLKSEDEQGRVKEEESKSSHREFLGFLKYKEIEEKDISDILEDLRLQLIESDVSYSVTQKILDDIKSALVGKKIKRGENLEKIVLDTLKKSINEVLERSKAIDILEEVKKGQKPYIIVFFGVNGVGKTTTIAKIGYLLKSAGYKVIIAACDTFRAAAQEQLEYHAKKLNIEIIKGKYGSDPASVAFDAIQKAKKNNFDVVLIDTAGRMHTDKNLVDELKRIVKITKPNLKILIIDALTGNDALEQAKYFATAVGFDTVILTKVDADVKGGIILSLAYS